MKLFSQSVRVLSGGFNSPGGDDLIDGHVGWTVVLDSTAFGADAMVGSVFIIGFIMVKNERPPHAENAV